MKLELETNNKKGVGNCKQCSTATTDSVVCFVGVGTRPIIMLVLFYLKIQKVSLICVFYYYYLPSFGLFIHFETKELHWFFFFFYFFGMRGLMGKDFYQQDLAVLLRPEPEGVALFIYLFFKKVALKHFLPHKMWSLLAHFEADNMPHLPPTSTGSHKS